MSNNCKKGFLGFYILISGASFQALSAEVQDDSAITVVNKAVSIAVLDNDSGNWVEAALTEAGNGVVTVSGQTLIYTPQQNFIGTDSFTYSLSESGGTALTATVTVSVLPLVQDDVVTTPFNTPIAIPFLDNDIGNWIGGDFTSGSNGTVVGKAGDGKTGPVLLYTPDPDFIGTDSFVYTLNESSGATSSAAVTVTVDPTGPGDATLPLFNCDSNAIICNVTQVAGLGPDINSGRGAAFIDYDGDGWDDIFAADTDGRLIPLDYGVSKFYKNNGDGSFKPVNAVDLGISEDDLFGTNGGSFADFDNDGDPDFLAVNGGYTAESTLAFYVNQVNVNGLFVKATTSTGIDVANQQLSNWWGASWADFDNDGFLDVAVTRTKGRPLLFHNNEGKDFTEVGVAMGIDVVFLAGPGVPEGFENGKNPVWIDFDNDGDADLYIAGIRKHAFYENVDGNSFVNITAQIFGDTIFQQNVNYPAGVQMVHAAAAEDFNQDGLDDIYLGRWNEQDMLLINNGDGTFQAFGSEIGLDSLHTKPENIARPYENTMGLGVGDLFNDGYPDVYLGTGNPERVGPDLLFCNEGGTGFRRCTEVLTTTADRVYRTHGHGTIFGDVDQDGNTDMFVSLGGHPVDLEHDGREQNALWVRPHAAALTATITLQGTTTNRDALGARVKVQAGSEIKYYAVRSTQAFQSQNSKALVVTLGNASEANVEVLWPGGGVSQAMIMVGQRLHIVE